MYCLPMETNVNSDYSGKCAAHARVHADKAEEFVKNSAKGRSIRAAGALADLRTMEATQATAHATLALYWQKEAER